MKLEHLILEEIDGLLIITMNRPEVLNAFNTKMATEFIAVFEAVAEPGAGTRCIVITGAGEKAFCAGADLKERRSLSEEAWARQHVVFERMFDAIVACPVPVIAAVNGLAYGGGGEIVVACDFAYADRSARFSQPEVRLAIFPGGGGTQHFPRAIGPKRAAEIILTGTPLSAQIAYEWGLINRLCDDGTVLEAACRTAREICGNGPLAVRQVKKCLRLSLSVDVASGLRFEREAYYRLIDSADRREGIAAFNEGRKPVFRGN